MSGYLAPLRVKISTFLCQVILGFVSLVVKFFFVSLRFFFGWCVNVIVRFVVVAVPFPGSIPEWVDYNWPELNFRANMPGIGFDLGKVVTLSASALLVEIQVLPAFFYIYIYRNEHAIWYP